MPKISGWFVIIVVILLVLACIFAYIVGRAGQRHKDEIKRINDDIDAIGGELRSAQEAARQLTGTITALGTENERIRGIVAELTDRERESAAAISRLISLNNELRDQYQSIVSANIITGEILESGQELTRKGRSIVGEIAEILNQGEN